MAQCVQVPQENLQMVQSLAASSGLVLALETSYPVLAKVLSMEPKGTILQLKKRGAIEAWKEDSKDIRYEKDCLGWSQCREDLKKFLHTAASNDIRFVDVINSVEEEIAIEWCRIYPSWVSTQNSPRTATYAIDASSKAPSTSCLGTMVFSVAGTVEATEWNNGSAGYRVKYKTNLSVKAVFIDDDKVRAIEEKMSTFGVDEAVSWLKKEYQHAGDLQIEDGAPF
jgi:hypothetical protein